MIYSLAPSHYLRRFLLRSIKANVAQSAVIHRNLTLITLRGSFEIGPKSLINPGCTLDTRGGISIGANAMVGAGTTIYTAGHDVNDRSFCTRFKGVTLEDWVVIFPNCLIMPGVTICEGGVALTGSVVTKNIGPYEVWGGNPAQKISERAKDLNYELISTAAYAVI